MVGTTFELWLINDGWLMRTVWDDTHIGDDLNPMIERGIPLPKQLFSGNQSLKLGRFPMNR